jgi:hypothetical protein
MDEEKKKSLPWWGWAIVAFLVLGLVSRLSGGGEEVTPDEVVTEEQVETAEVAEAVDEYDPCSTNGNLFIIRAEDKCLEPWPLDSASGVLYCNPFGEVNDSVVYQPDEDPSMYYALNGSALASGYPDIDPIWLDDPEGPSPKVNLGAVTAAALELCG